MAFEITNEATQFSLGFKAPFRVELADLTATSASQDMTAARKHLRAFIYQKAFTAGTGTAPHGVIYRIEVADDTGFTSNVRSIAEGRAARADEQTVVLVGMTPFVAGQQFARIVIVEEGTDAATYDAILEAA